MNNPIKPPEVPEIQKVIELVKSIDLRTKDIDSLKEILFPIFKGYIKSTPHFEPGLILYRGIKCNKIPNNLNNLKHPPKEKTKDSRVNRSGNPVFYCSTARGVPFFELDCIPGNTIAISKWKTVDKLLVNNVGYTDTCFSKLNSNRNNPKYGEIKKETEVPTSNSLIDDFLTNEFTKVVPVDQEYLYKISIAIAEKLFSDDLFDGLLYPTIPMRGNADNLAIKPRYLDENKLKIESVEFIRIDSKKDFTFQVTVLDFANSFKGDGSIEWKGRLPQWVLKEKDEELAFTAENGVWVARDKNGNIVEPE